MKNVIRVSRARGCAAEKKTSSQKQASVTIQNKENGSEGGGRQTILTREMMRETVQVPQSQKNQRMKHERRKKTSINKYKKKEIKVYPV